MDRNPLLGTWKLKSYVATTAGGTRSTPYGDHPIGYLSYSDDGRMQTVGAANHRPTPAVPRPSDQDRLALYDTMFAYAGTYSVEAGRVIHHVDVSWNEVWSGTAQVRFFDVSGDTLTLTTRTSDPATGTETQYAVVWERVANAR